VEYELVTVDLMKGEHKSPEHLKLQPFGAIPVLEDGDLRMFESRAIARYIANKWANQGTDLLGKTEKQRALAETWLEVEGQNYNPPVSKIVYELVFKQWSKQEADPKVVEAESAKLEKVLDVYEAHLSKNQYLAGDEFTLADLSHLPYTDLLLQTDAGKGFLRRAHLKAWWERISSRPSWLKITGSKPIPLDAEPRDVEEYKKQLKGAAESLKELYHSTHANPIIVRIGWHDSGTYDKNIPASEWPKAGGAVGSIRFKPELSHGANAGLDKALALLEPIKQKYPLVSYADLFQLGSKIGIEEAGGPKLPLKFGRVDVTTPEECSPEGNLPAAVPGTELAPGLSRHENAAQHLRRIFYRMGLTDQDIVALSGAHTIGRSHADRSGFGAKATKYTTGDNIGAPGGSSWVPDWLVFNNSYFQVTKDLAKDWVDPAHKRDPELISFSTDQVLFQDPDFAKYAEKYRESQDAFFADYAVSHKKLSELGSKFDPPEGIAVDF
jgi:glutathione S-transferase